jgi:hypothetical protein
MTGRNKGPSYSDVLEKGPRIAPKDSCSFDKKIQLQRVDPEQAKGLQKGRPLDIRLRKVANVFSVVCVRPDNNKVLGSVAFAGVAKLIDCMKKDRRYEATIESISGAAVQVRIFDI